LVAADIVGDPAPLDGGLRIDAALGPEGATIAFRGDLDLAGVGAAEAAINDAMAGPGDVTVDLGGLEFMGSEGIRMLLRARERAEAEGRVLRVIAAGGAARRLIDILGLAERLELGRDDR
jgi:stage II sporulation protein AA (anti-sigma F factor antagonist)